MFALNVVRYQFDRVFQFNIFLMLVIGVFCFLVQYDQLFANMAQYYQVLSQGDKPNMENLRQFYPNIVENQGVQYVISHDAQPAFQDEEVSVQVAFFIYIVCNYFLSQVLVASEKYIVVENSPQSRIVVDPGHYKNQQYVIQETLNETTRTTYLMEETKQATDATVAKSVQQSIVVAPDLNLRSSISTNISKIVNATRKPQMSAKNIQSPIVVSLFSYIARLL